MTIAHNNRSDSEFQKTEYNFNKRKVFNDKGKRKLSDRFLATRACTLCLRLKLLNYSIREMANFAYNLRWLSVAAALMLLLAQIRRILFANGLFTFSSFQNAPKMHKSIIIAHFYAIVQLHAKHMKLLHK